MPTLLGRQTRELMDLQTGEVIQVEQVTKTIPGGKQFWKVYMTDFLEVLEGFECRQLEVLAHIIRNTNPTNNLYFGTYSEISQTVGVCRQTIASLMRRLQRQGFVKKVRGGVWMVNPNVLMKGSDRKRHMLLDRYDGTK